MNYQRVNELLGAALSTGNFNAIEQAAPDTRLTRPVGNYGFPGREFAPGHARAAAWPLACSGVRPPLPDID